MAQKFKVMTVDTNQKITERLLAKHGYIVSNLQSETVIALDSAGHIRTDTSTVNKISISKTIELLRYVDIVIDRGVLIEVRRDICEKMHGDITEEIIQVGLKEFTLSLFNKYLLKLDATEKTEIVINVYSV